MNRTMSSKKYAAKKERMEQKLETGFVSSLFPEVTSIVINMTYSQIGLLKSLPRTVNFFPDSYAFFRVDCLSKECLEGGFDLTGIITSMVKNRKKKVKGELSCEGKELDPGHSSIVYEVVVKYS
jgi:hypothetical protein